jgi:hypothetical protein
LNAAGYRTDALKDWDRMNRTNQCLLLLFPSVVESLSAIVDHTNYVVPRVGDVQKSSSIYENGHRAAKFCAGRRPAIALVARAASTRKRRDDPHWCNLTNFVGLLVRNIVIAKSIHRDARGTSQ